MKDLREEVGTKACIVGKIVKSRMKWAGHKEGDGKVTDIKHDDEVEKDLGVFV